MFLSCAHILGSATFRSRNMDRRATAWHGISYLNLTSCRLLRTSTSHIVITIIIIMTIIIHRTTIHGSSAFVVAFATENYQVRLYTRWRLGKMSFLPQRTHPNIRICTSISIRTQTACTRSQIVMIHRFVSTPERRHPTCRDERETCTFPDAAIPRVAFARTYARDTWQFLTR